MPQTLQNCPLLSQKGWPPSRLSLTKEWPGVLGCVASARGEQPLDISTKFAGFITREGVGAQDFIQLGANLMPGGLLALHEHPSRMYGFPHMQGHSQVRPVRRGRETLSRLGRQSHLKAQITPCLDTSELETASRASWSSKYADARAEHHRRAMAMPRQGKRLKATAAASRPQARPHRMVKRHPAPATKTEATDTARCSYILASHGRHQAGPQCLP